MSSTPPGSTQHPEHPNRRICPRRKSDQITFVELGPENGGILIDLSEGGLSFQGVVALQKDGFLRLNFKLPGSTTAIETTGKVVWSNESGKGGGLRFVNLNSRFRQQIQDWISGEVSSPVDADTQVTLATAHSVVNDNLAAPQEKPPAPASPPWQEPSPAPDQNIQGRSANTWTGVHPMLGQTPSAPTAPPKPERKVVSLRGETPPPRKQNASKPWAFPFVMGIACGYIVFVVTLTVGLHVLEVGMRPAAAETRTSPPAAGQGAASAKNNTDTENTDDTKNPAAEPVRRSTVRDQTGGATLALSSTGEIPRRNEEAYRRATNSTAPSENFGDANGAARSNVAMLAPNGTPQPQAAYRDPSRGVDIPAAPATVPLVVAAPSVIAAPSVPAPAPAPAPAKQVAPPPATLAPTVASPAPAAAAPAATSPTANFRDAVQIAGASAVYPQRLKKGYPGGLVQISVTIGTDGVPREVGVVGDPNLVPAALEAIRHWRYVPAVLDGRPVESHAVIAINFPPKS